MLVCKLKNKQKKANLEALDAVSALFLELAVWLDSQYCSSCCVKAVLAA